MVTNEALGVTIERTSNNLGHSIWVPRLDRVIATASIAVVRVCVRIIRRIIELKASVEQAGQ